MNRKLYLLTALLLIFFCGCRQGKVSRTLNDVETFIMDRPDSALSILDTMDRTKLHTDRTRAVKSKFSTNNFKKIRIPQFSETRFGSFVGLFLCFDVYKQ